MNEPDARTDVDLTRVTIRPYRPADQQAVAWLYEKGLLRGFIPEHDTGADIENIHDAYLATDRGGFWVAEYEGRVVGMIGVAEDEPHLAEIRRLRVAPTVRGNGIGIRLMETAIQFCRDKQYLKVVLDTRIESGPAKEIFDRFAFQHNRTKEVKGKELQEFYLDLYREPNDTKKLADRQSEQQPGRMRP